MSRYNPHSDISPILDVATRWRDQCLLNEGSLFTQEKLWTGPHVQELIKHFVDNPDEGDRSFLEKLEEQLAPASENAKILAAEILYVMLLGPSNITPEKKRENVNYLLGWTTRGPLDESHPLFQKSVLQGIGSGGTGFNNYRWKEAAYFIRLLQAWCDLQYAERSELLADGWKFATWMQAIPDNDNRQLRHMLLYLLFPDLFERTFGGKDRLDIVAAFEKRRLPEVRQLTALELDKSLNQIRQQAVEEYGTEDLDFYAPPLRHIWKGNDTGSWLFVWNPSSWDWAELPAAIAACRRGETVSIAWSCANQRVAIGDKAWLMRTGVPPKGIFATGTVMSDPYEAPHLDADKAAAGETRMCVDIGFTAIRDIYKDPHITEQDLAQITIDKQVWFPQSSGIEIKPRSAGLLEKLWEKLKPVASKPDNVSAGTAQKALNVIFYGPPGTGKTYRLNKIKDTYTSATASISHEQWLTEQLQGERWFSIVYMALLDLGGEGSVSDILGHEFVVQKAKALGRTQHIRQQVWATLQAHAAEDSATVKYAARTPPLVFDKDAKSRWHLLDGHEDECAELVELRQRIKIGPQRGSSTPRYEFVTFHQAYSYEDFVEGIRPVQDEQPETLAYRVMPGTFRRICQRAKQDPDKRYAIMIDEINRGNIAKIFGELITLIEIDKREGAENAMEVTLPYSGDRFSVPGNLDIYGTMNTADRSIALLDTALRRRFTFQELLPDPALIKGSRGDGYIEDGEGGLINLRLLLGTMNQRICFLLSRDLMLGHAYLHKVTNFPELRTVFVDQFIPLLQEYFYNDWQRMQLVFQDITQDGSAVQPQLIQHTRLQKDKVLGFDHEDFEDQIEYQVAKPSTITPDSIRKIYEPMKS